MIHSVRLPVVKPRVHMAVRGLQGSSLRESRFERQIDPNHLIGECPKPPRDKNQRAFVGGSWSDSGEEDDEKIQDETCLVAQAPNEICLGVNLEPDEWIKDSGCSKHMTGNRKLFSTYKAYNGGNVIFGSNLRGFQLNPLVTFDETPPPSKTSLLVDDDLDEEEAIRKIEKKNLENVIEDETLEIDEIVNIKESRNHPLENVIGNLNQRTLRSQAQNQTCVMEFAKKMHDEVRDEHDGELKLILGLQIKQMEDEFAKDFRNMYLSFHHVFIFVDRASACGNESDSAGMRYVQRTFLIGFRGSTSMFSLPEPLKSNNTNLTSYLPHSLFDVDSGRIPIVTMNTKEYHSDVLIELPQELSRVHNTFHVSNLKKCYFDDPLVVSLEGLQVDDKLHFVEEPVEIMDCEVKQLRRIRVPIVKVRWNSRRGP
ncbi:hypothetical protein Tco_0454671 [Tanacetum coccineum]